MEVENNISDEGIIFIYKRCKFTYNNIDSYICKVVGIENAKFIDDDNVKVSTGVFTDKTLKSLFSDNNDDLVFSDIEYDLLDMYDGNLLENMATLILSNNYYIVDTLNREFILIDKNGNNQQLIDVCKQIFEDEEPVKEINIEKIYHNISNKIISQNEQIKTILATINRNQELINKGYSNDEIRELKQSILVIGKTGTGKTAIIREIAKEFGLVIDIENAKDFTENGYIGKSIDTIFKNFYNLAEGDIRKAENGILILDEFDKLAFTNDEKGVSTLSVQKNLLSLIEGFKYYVTEDKGDNMGNFYFDTSKLTVIVCGAFENIDEITKKRLNINKAIGFDNHHNNHIIALPNEEDIIKYGFLRELIGRLEKIVIMNELHKDDYRKILLTSNNSPLLNEKKYLSDKNLEVSWTNEFIEEICIKAEKSGLGARALKKLISEYIGERQYKIESKTLKHINLDSKDKQKTLKMESM